MMMMMMVNIVEHINTYSYHGCSMSYQNKKDITVKISKFLQISGIINVSLKPSQVQKQARLKICNALALPALS